MRLFRPKEKRPVQTGNGNRDKFNREQHAADNGIGIGRSEDEVQAQEFRCLAGRRFPGREQEGENERRDHAIEDVQVEFLWRRGTALSQAGFARSAR